MSLTMASLFDGSGGFPLAASLCGIEPVWASEVEPYPIAVTRQRFPQMEHLGDVSKIHGGEVEPVDIITFGSPCQDMSIAGKRAGIKNENAGDDETTRSGLFYEAARIIKEMREATNGKYPRYAVWENVLGAFSSNKGEDFRLVLQTLIQIVEPTAVVPPVPKAGWNYYDCWMGDGWSIAYRTVDAQYWGVPQRRRRIYLVVDFAGQRAGEILFKREGLRRYSAESGTARQGTAADAAGGAGVCNCWPEIAGTLTARFDGSPQPDKGNGSGICVYCLQGNTIDRNARQNGRGICKDVMFTLNAVDRHGVVATGFKAGQGAQARSIGWAEEQCPTLAAEAGGNSVPSVCMKSALPFDTTQVTSPQNWNSPKWGDPCHPLAATGHPPTVICEAYDARGNGDGKTVGTLTGDHERRPSDYTTILCMAHGQANAEVCANLAPCLNCNHEQPIVFDKEVYNSGANATGGHYIAEGGLAPTLRVDGHPPGVCIFYIVRRLTPTECARLQGFPDRWGDVPLESSLDDMEDLFWLEVRQTYDAINGRPVKDYTTKQILLWYNNLHTDSAEYKMWGNGIALPCALYVMEGIADG